MLAEIGFSAAFGAFVSLLVCRAVMAAGLMDMAVGARRAHLQPTPTSGGLGIAVGFALAMMALSFAPLWRAQAEAESALRLTVTTAVAYAFLGLGFFDDARPLGPRVKFVLFAVLSVSGALAAGVVKALPLSEAMTLELVFPLGLIGSALWVFTLANAVNFMDGSNGLAMGSVAIGLVALGAIALAAGAPSAAAMALCGAGALAGFLFWNFPHGRLFAGDSGALFAGALAALASLAAIGEGGISPFIPPILFFPLLGDVLLTLAWRLSQGRKLFDGHSEHLYQIGLRPGQGHAAVALLYWAAMAACGGLGYAAAAGWIAPPLALASLALLALAISAALRKAAAAR